ncbi:MAG: C39 family peptidase [Spirochaetales bacterium]|nr:C39 family peptidase [Spirochaetales bacterium]
MGRKYKLFIVVGILCLLIFTLLIIGRALPSIGVIITQNKDGAHSLRIDKNIFYRQTYNNCAPYSVMAVIGILRNKNIDPEKLSSEITWRIGKNLVYPTGIIELLTKYGIRSDEYILSPFTEKEKINWLKNKIDDEKPIILLIGLPKVRHYVTVIGYDNGGFFLYDSLQAKSKNDPRKTIIDNKEGYGNRYYNYARLIKLWDSGGLAVFYRNWALVCSL